MTQIAIHIISYQYTSHHTCPLLLPVGNVNKRKLHHNKALLCAYWRRSRAWPSQMNYTVSPCQWSRMYACVGAFAHRRRLTIPHAWPTCVRSLSCVRAACVRVYDAACVAVLHVHSRMCVNVLRAYVDVVIRVRAVPSIFHASFSRLFACSGPLHFIFNMTRINAIDVYYKLCIKLTWTL